MAIPKWRRFEHTLSSASEYPNPFHDVALSAEFIAPSGSVQSVDGFWDGNLIWRIRFSPDETGTWTFA